MRKPPRKSRVLTLSGEPFHDDVIRDADYLDAVAAQDAVLFAQGAERAILGRLRVRGSPALRAALWLKITCWNILRASSTVKVRALNHKKLAAMGFLGPFLRCFSLFPTLPRLKSRSQTCSRELQKQIQSSHQKLQFATV